MGRARKLLGLGAQRSRSAIGGTSVTSVPQSTSASGDNANPQVDMGPNDIDPIDSVELTLLKETRLKFRVATGDAVHIFLPNIIAGKVVTTVQLRFFAVTVTYEGGIPCYVCTCNPTDKKVRQQLFHKGFYQSSSCIHGAAARYHYPLDFERDPLEVMPESHVKLCENPRLFCSMPSNCEPAVVRLLNGGRKWCLMCSRGTEGCEHVRNMDMLNRDEPAGNEAEHSTDVGHADWGTMALPILCNGKTTFELRRLQMCSHYNIYKDFSRQVTVVNYHGQEETKLVTFQTAAECSCINQPPVYNDLQEIAPNYFVVVELMARILAAGLTCQTPLSAFLKSLQMEAKIMNSAHKLINIKKLTAAYDEFRDKLETKKEWFSCQTCGEYPATLVCDGVQMGTRKPLICHMDTTIDVQPKPRSVLPHKKRIFIAEKGVRTRVQKFARGEVTMSQLLSTIPKEYDVLLQFLEASCDIHGRCVPECVALVSDLASSSSLLVVFPDRHDGHKILREIVNGWNPYTQAKDMEQIMQLYPILHGALVHHHTQHGFIPEVAKQLIATVCAKLSSLENRSIETEDIAPIENELDIFPGLPKLRTLPLYCNDEIQLDCDKKLQRGKRNLSSGLMLYICPHAKVYGAQMMTTGESPRHVFDVLLTRFPKDKIPSLVVYDNACHLAEFCLSREYDLFKKTTFLVDRFHGFNHKTCSRSTRIANYQWTPDLAQLNTQLCEQRNAQLKYLRRFVSYMNKKTYIQTIRLYIAHTNNNLGL